MPTTTIRHTDKRTTIPTAELAEFVPDDDKAAKVVRYPRDPSLDPQLVWKGKDEQDSEDLQVRAPAIYVQEKVSPKAIIDDLQAQKKEGKPAIADLFADFDGVGFDELVAAYQHHDKQSWSNRFILGDSLLVMNSLAVRENLKGRVQCIYLDPPYGIKFNSNWQVSTRKRDVKDGKAEDATRQPEQVKAFRDTWKLGIHSYLSYLRDRLVVARELLTDSGSVFVQIGDENVHLVRSLLDEVFGSDNLVSQITYKKTAGATGDFLGGVVDSLLWYGKDIGQTKYRALYAAAVRARGSSFATTTLPASRPAAPKETVRRHGFPCIWKARLTCPRCRRVGRPTKTACGDLRLQTALSVWATHSHMSDTLMTLRCFRSTIFGTIRSHLALLTTRSTLSRRRQRSSNAAS